MVDGLSGDQRCLVCRRAPERTVRRGSRRGARLAACSRRNDRPNGRGTRGPSSPLGLFVLHRSAACYRRLRSRRCDIDRLISHTPYAVLMVDKISASEFHGRTDLPDWRVVLRRIDAGFRAPSFYDAATFVGQIASAAERAGHHPDVDVRYPGIVYVSLTTHATNSLTEADVDLATTISAMAADAGLTTEP